MCNAGVKCSIIYVKFSVFSKSDFTFNCTDLLKCMIIIIVFGLPNTECEGQVTIF
jgi:hypothetical protein